MPIFDQGYQHWSGVLSGHTWRWLTIARHGVRVGMKNILLRLLIIASWAPAAFLAFVLCVWGLIEQKSSIITNVMPWVLAFLPPEMAADPKHFRLEIWTIAFDWFLWFEMQVSMIVVLLVGPGLISQDLRFNALPLYFSRPLRRIDYFAGKLGVVAWFLGLVIVFPSLIAYVLGLLFSLDITIVRDTFPLLVGCLGYGLIIVLSAGTLILALSSLSRNSRYIALFWVGLWFVSGVAGVTLNTVDIMQRGRKAEQKARAENQAPPPPRHAGRQPTPEEEAAWEERGRKREEEMAAEFWQASRTNWRWLPSYTANLSRLGQELLGSDTAWKGLSRLEPEREREAFLYVHTGPQYPWYWSALVLAVLFGSSVWILHSRIRSLDRLK